MPKKMKKNLKIRLGFFLFSGSYAFALYLFYFKYVPIIKPFQLILIPILCAVFILTVIRVQSGTLFFIFSFPLINNLPYFFGITEPIPHAPTALVLFLFFFLGWLTHYTFFESKLSFNHQIFKPLILFSILIFVSGIITLFRFANFFPFFSDHVYELITNVNGVTVGGAMMSTIFFSLNYLTGFAFLFILLAVMESKEFIKKLMIVLCLSTFLSLSFGLFQNFKNMELGNNPISINQALINATFKDALSFGAYIAIIFPLVLGALFYFKRIARILPFLILILSLYLIFFSGSKSGLICLFISLLIFLTLSINVVFDLIKSKAIPLKNIAFSSLVVILLIVAIIFSFTIFKENMNRSITYSRFNSMFKLGISNFYSIYRARLWKLASHMVKDYPLTGVGMGGYIIESANYSNINKASIGVPQSAENYFLQVGSELGVIGLFLVLWIFWEIIKQMKRSYLKFPSNDKNKFILIGAIAGVISFFVNIQVHSYIGSYEIKYTFWLLVALVFCLGRGEKEEEEKVVFSKNFKILGVVLIVLFSGIHLWNSTHSLSLKNRTEQFGLKQDFGFDKIEKTNEGREFRWTRGYGGMTIKIEKPLIEISLLASHPDIQENPVKVKIFLIKDFFKQKKLLDEIILTKSVWETYEYYIPEEVDNEVILLFKVSRIWNPLKTLGTPDPRNLGVAVGKIGFKLKE